VGAGRLAQRGQVGDPAVGGLGGADRDERRAGPYGLGEPLQRHGAHLEVTADVERVQHGGEVVLGGEDFGPRGQPGGDQRGLGRDGRAGRDPGGRDTGQPAEGGAGQLDVLEEGVDRPARGPQGHRLVHGRDGTGGEQAAARGVQKRALRGELGTDEGLEDLHKTTVRPEDTQVHCGLLRGLPKQHL
jgi:hypothetical protein